MSKHTSSQQRGGGTRPGAQIVIDHRRAGADLARLAEKVVAAAGRADQLVVLTDDPAGASAQLRRQSAFRIVARTGPTLAADLAALASELPDGSRPLCVVEDSAVPGTDRWLSDLLQPIAAGEADVTMPATNAAPFPSAPANCPIPAASADEIRQAARSCRAAQAGRTVGRLHGPVTCFGPGTLARLSGAADRVAALEAGDLRLLELPRTYVHDTVHVPQVTACLIMKDEAADLADCLASLRPVADEVVIYDTGSTDGSVELARSLGATVVEGTWHNDFARARNEALALARGTWVLSIDPDERLELEPRVAGEVRALLDDDPPVDRFVIDLYDLQGSVHAPVRSASGVPMSRLFRRRRCHWVGALHEQPEARPGQPALRAVALPGLCFLHRGYLDEVVRDRGKWARNLAVATAGIDGVPDSAKDCFDLGRSLRSVGEHARAFTLFERAADLDDNVVITRAALEFAVLTLMDTGRAAMATPHLDRLSALDGGAGPARYLRGWAHLHQQQWADAVDCFDGVTDYDDNFTGFRAESLSLGLAIAYRGLDRHEDAAAAAVATLQRNPLALEAWAVLFHCAPAGGDDDLAAARALPPEHLTPLFAQLGTMPVSVRDRLAEAIWQIRPGDRVVLAVASQIAGQLDAEPMLEWATRLRASGLAALCPMSAVAQDGARTVAERAELLARGVDRFDDDDLAVTLEELVGRLHDEELADLLGGALAGFGGAAASIIVAGATSPARCLLIVRALQEAGFADEALSVLGHVGELDGGATRRLLDASPDLLLTLRHTAAERGRDDVFSLLAA